MGRQYGNSSERPVASASRLTARERVGLAGGTIAGQGPHSVVHTLSHQVLNLNLGMNPAWISILIFVQRLWSALLDPLFGQASDNLRTAFGRRRPALLVAALPLALAFAAFWRFPAGTGPAGLFLHVLAVSLVLYAAMSLYSVALGGLQIEVTTDYHQRTRLAAFLQICFFGFTIAAQWIFPLLQRSAAPVLAAGRMGLIGGGIFLVAALVPVFLVRERLYAGVVSRQQRVGLRESLQAARANPAFLRLLLATFSANLGYYLASALSWYLNYYYVYGGAVKTASTMQGWLGTGFQVAAILALLGFRQLSARIGKYRAFQAAAAVQIFTSIAKCFCVTPAAPSLQMIVYVANGAAFAGVGLLSVSMLADVVDGDEAATGRRGEGVYAALLAWGDKLAGALGMLGSAAIFPLMGFHTAQGAAQSSGTWWAMRLGFAGFPLVGAVAAILLLRNYPIDETAARNTKVKLEARRALQAAV